ncbi:MAG: hypothetical protein ACRD63_11295 [Pyrinomonadaceae bacterium]
MIKPMAGENRPIILPNVSGLVRPKGEWGILLDVTDARRVATMAGDPSRYGAAIEQATAYATCLKQNGIIN